QYLPRTSKTRFLPPLPLSALDLIGFCPIFHLLVEEHSDASVPIRQGPSPAHATRQIRRRPKRVPAISEQGTKSWVFRYRRDDKCHHMGLGPYDLLSLAEVRDRGYQARRQLLDGVDPLEAKRDAKRQRRAAQTRAMTLKQAALAYIATQEPSWRSN